MCKVAEMQIDNRIVCIADIKHKYVKNIVDAARECKIIDKIIVFGSSLDERCTDKADIDIAVFGNKTKYKTFHSKAYKEFLKKIYAYDFDQDYDVLYFMTGTEDSQQIFNDIMNGEIIYAKNNEE